MGDATSHIFLADAFSLKVIHHPLMVFHKSFLFSDRMTQIVGLYTSRHSPCAAFLELFASCSYLTFCVFVQITRRDDTIQQLEGDLDASRKQLKDAIEEVQRFALHLFSFLAPKSAKKGFSSIYFSYPIGWCESEIWEEHKRRLSWGLLYPPPPPHHFCPLPKFRSVFYSRRPLNEFGDRTGLTDLIFRVSLPVFSLAERKARS